MLPLLLGFALATELPPEAETYAVNGLVGVIGGPLLFLGGYLTFQSEPLGEKDPVWFGFSSAAMGGGFALIGHGVGAMVAKHRVRAGARADDPRRLALDLARADRTLHLADAITGGLVVAMSGPFLAWAVNLSRQDAHDAWSAGATGVGLALVGGTQLTVGALQLEQRTPIPTVAWVPGPDGGAVTFGATARW